MRPIDADALLEKIKDWIEYCSGHTDIVHGIMHDVYESVVDDIKDAPTIDVQPVRRSEWRYVNYQTDKTTWITGEFICRKCGKSIPRHMGDNPPDYCQHCGADMRRADDDKID